VYFFLKKAVFYHNLAIATDNLGFAK